MDLVVVTNNEFGWDCVCGVFQSKYDAVAWLNDGEAEPLTLEDYSDKGYVFTDKMLDLSDA